MKMGYSYQGDDKVVEAMGKEVRVSPKHSYEVCNVIRGMKLEPAKKFLENITDLKVAVPFKRYNRDIGHKKGGLGAGRYPVKASREVLGVLENAESNADFKGLDTKKLVITSISAHKGRVTQNRRKGSNFNCPTTNIEVVLGEE